MTNDHPQLLPASITGNVTRKVHNVFLLHHAIEKTSECGEDFDPKNLFHKFCSGLSTIAREYCRHIPPFPDDPVRFLQFVRQSSNSNKVQLFSSFHFRQKEQLHRFVKCLLAVNTCVNYDLLEPAVIITNLKVDGIVETGFFIGTATGSNRIISKTSVNKFLILIDPFLKRLL